MASDGGVPDPDAVYRRVAAMSGLGSSISAGESVDKTRETTHVNALTVTLVLALPPPPRRRASPEEHR